MVLFVLGGSVINAFFLSQNGFTISSGGSLSTIIDWRTIIAWIALYPIVWSLIATYSFPVKLRFSPLDLEIATILILIPFYWMFGRADWVSVSFFSTLILIPTSFLQALFVGSVVGLGKAGGPPYYYDSFILPSKSVSDFSRCYENEQYRDWLALPKLELVRTRGTLNLERAIISSAGYDDLVLYVILSNSEKGLLVQIIAFEKGKYSIFKSKYATFCAGQIKNVLQWELKTAEPIPFVDEAEREVAEHYALRVTRSIAVVRDLRKRDQIVLATGAALLALEYFLWVFNVFTSADSYVGYSILTGFGVIAELSYRRLKGTRIWERITRKPSSSTVEDQDVKATSREG
jgi:hypothetical protein